MLSRRTRLLGCVAGALLFGTGAANAATITWVADQFTGSVPLLTGSGQLTPQEIGGTVTAAGALSYLSDWVEFTVAPTTGTTVTVDVLANLTGAASFPNEFFRLTSVTTSGAVVLAPVGVTTGSNTPVTTTLTGGVNYFLELTSRAPLVPPGNSSFNVTVPTGAGGTTPLPGALVLFGTVLAGAGLFMRRRRDGGAALAA